MMRARSDTSPCGPASVGLALVSVLVGCGGPVTIDVDPSTRHQTFEAWSATVEIGDSDLPQARIAQYREEVLDWVVDSLGITRLRLPVKSGYENHADLAPAFLADNSLVTQWHRTWFKIENDNDDPYVADPSGFQFFFMDHLMETVVLPIKERLEARGERLYLNLNYVDFDSSAFEHRDNPEEFAEFMLVVVRHLDEKYGVVADAMEILEPDNDAQWTANDVAVGLVAVGDRLEAAGYDLDFIGPSNITVRGALQYIDVMMGVPGMDRYLTELSYHKYGQTEPADLGEIGRVAERYGLRTSMLEYLDATTRDVHEDLTLANVSAWQKYTILRYLQADSAGRVSYRRDDDSRELVEYMRGIRPGAVRLEATSTRDDFQPVAFRNVDGGDVLLVRARRGRTFTIRGLPDGPHEAHAILNDGYARVPVTLSPVEGGEVGGEMPEGGLLVVRSAARS